VVNVWKRRMLKLFYKDLKYLWLSHLKENQSKFLKRDYASQIDFWYVLKLISKSLNTKYWKYIQWNLEKASLDTALILLLSQFLTMPDFFPPLSLLNKPQYSVIFTTSILLQHQFCCKPKTFFSYTFQPRYNINLKNEILSR